ncbi:hypothetical protein ACFWOB_40380 [Streptomyces sp. NPDC058420]|jgi:hypothetical protein|uniref:hypothetical protein n=1 Tax=Streptomyces sp. NPDC058420 TaxID=3346489 RepID=UPI003652A3E5
MGQTIVTSHSPYVIEKFDPAHIVVLGRGRVNTGRPHAALANPPTTTGRDLPTLALLDRIASALDCRLTVIFTSSPGQSTLSP